MALFVRTCCCGCDLRVGTMLIGIFSLLGSAYFAFANLKYVYAIRESQDETLKDYIGLAYAGGVVAIISIILSTVLIGAAEYSKRGPILCWLIWEIVLLVMNVGLAVFAIVSFGFTTMAIVIIVGGAGWFIQIYFLIVVYSFAQELLEEQQQNEDPRPANTLAMGNFSEDASPPYKQLDNVV